MSASDNSSDRPVDLPDEVLADLQRLVDDMSEGPTTPTSSGHPGPPRPAPTSRPRAGSFSAHAGLSGSLDAVPGWSREVPRFESEPKSESEPAPPPARKKRKKREPSRRARRRSDDQDMLADVDPADRFGDADRLRIDGTWLRYNWPFVLAAVFIALGVVLILLVLASNGA